MATHGRVPKFNSAQQDWPSYAERLEQYFAAVNEIKDEGKMQAILLSVCGPSTYRLMRNLCTPSKPTEKSYFDLVKLVTDHFNPTPSVMYSDSVLTVVIANLENLQLLLLQNYAVLQNFVHLEVPYPRCYVIYQYVEWCPRIQKRLLAEPNLTFDKALELALAQESAEQNATQLQKTPVATFSYSSNP